MAKVISNVMPMTFHRLCKWYIMQNATKHVSRIATTIKTNSNMSTKSIKDKLAYFMDHIDEEADFITDWDQMLDDFDVHDKHWLDTFYNVKKKWAHAYVRLHWCAGHQKGNESIITASTITSIPNLLGNVSSSDPKAIELTMTKNMVTTGAQS
ncbi:hypothetical protein L1049_017885 [Liquidambar formosana]|uniref:Protein FAR1-RELATED SEQUENCE n=1 Tax=Liquidambar formosana TaxID=63359 RepID=A0AAP0NHI9_LIQFO